MSNKSVDSMTWQIVVGMLLAGLVLTGLRVLLNPNNSVCSYEEVRDKVPGICGGWVG